MKIKLQNSEGGEHEGFFTEKLNTYLQIPKKSYPRGKVIRPSDITKCIRGIVCDILGFPQEGEVTPRQQRIFDNGNFVHKRYLEDYLIKLGCAAQVNGKNGIEYGIVNKDYWLKGKPDAVIFNDIDNLLYIFELKSVMQETFERLLAPTQSHIAQVYLYMFLTGIPRAIVFYENKNTQETKEFCVVQNDKLLQTYLSRIRLIQQYVMNYPETNTLPTCECGGRQCGAFIIETNIKESEDESIKEN